MISVCDVCHTYDALCFQLITYWWKLCRLFEYPAFVETAEERNYPNIRSKDILEIRFTSSRFRFSNSQFSTT